MSAPDLFPGTKPARAKPRVLLRVVDAGCCDGGDLVHLQCERCGHDGDWQRFRTVSEARHQPCPNCNQEKRA